MYLTVRYYDQQHEITLQYFSLILFKTIFYRYALCRIVHNCINKTYKIDVRLPIRKD